MARTRSAAAPQEGLEPTSTTPKPATRANDQAIPATATRATSARERQLQPKTVSEWHAAKEAEAARNREYIKQLQAQRKQPNTPLSKLRHAIKLALTRIDILSTSFMLSWPETLLFFPVVILLLVLLAVGLFRQLSAALALLQASGVVVVPPLTMNGGH